MLSNFLSSRNKFQTSLWPYDEKNLDKFEIECLVAMELGKYFAKYGRGMIKNTCLQSIFKDFFMSMKARQILIKEGGIEALAALYSVKELENLTRYLHRDEMLGLLFGMCGQLGIKMYQTKGYVATDRDVSDFTLMLRISINIVQFYQMNNFDADVIRTAVGNVLGYSYLPLENRDTIAVLDLMYELGYCPGIMVHFLIAMKDDVKLYVHALPILLKYASDHEEYDTVEFYEKIVPTYQAKLDGSLAKMFLNDPLYVSENLLKVFIDRYEKYLSQEDWVYLVIAQRNVDAVRSYFERNEGNSRDIIFEHYFEELNLP